ncbi:MAG: hypothetical protein H7A24_13755 [Leptospiraceae bacterium]|nr:hypothetical protein [Leptospiraceae bacterium]MCP5512944.1 hypothetical protein [Leptospiraceae bacterium]
MAYLFYFLLIFVSNYFLYGDEYHSIQGLYGNKALGMGGAYTAISDEPSGMYYNPAGMSFSQSSNITVNATTYQYDRKTYHNVFGPAQNYTRESKNLGPNFVGILQKLNNLTVGFSLINIQSKKYSLSGEINLPYFSPEVDRYKADSLENTMNFLAGPGISYLLGSKISVGMSLFYSYDNEDNIFTGSIEKKDGTISAHTMKVKRLTKGVLPVLGIQYLVTEKLSLGVSLKKMFTVIHNKRYSSNTLNAIASGNSFIRNKEFIESSDSFFVAYDEPMIIAVKSPNLGTIAEPTEVRLGLAYFASHRFLVSGDVIYTGSYHYSKRNYGVIFPEKAVISADNTILNNINRKETYNFALGAEYFLTESIALRLGVFSNYSNTKYLSKQKLYVERFFSNPFSPLPIPITPNYYHIFPSKRLEHVTQFGYTLGLSYETSKAFYSFTILAEDGRGLGFAFNSSVPQKISYLNFNFYLSAGTNY